MRRRFASSLCLCGLIATVAPAAPPASSPALRQVEADQRQREEDRDHALADAETARREIAQLEGQLGELDRAEQGGERSVSDKRLRLAALNVRENDLKARLGGDRNQLARLLGALELFRRDPPPALLVDPHDIRDAVRAAILIRAITPEIEARVQNLNSEAEAIRKARREVATASADLFTAESDVADRRAKIEAVIATKTTLERRAATDADAANQDIAALADRARALRGLAQSVGGGPPPPDAHEPPDPEHAGLFGAAKPFVAPVAGAPARTFGQIEPGGGRSLGWAWDPPAGAVVSAPASALIDYAGPLKGWGLVLILRLGGGYHLVLAGLETALTAPGRTVAAGQPLGRMAGPGGSAQELYFEIRKNGAPVDPARWLKAPALATGNTGGRR
jgi:septal ring factor EnvC (AmiA/AmiB activator)